MDYNRQLEEIINYFEKSEKKVEDFKIGVEFEHFVIDLDSYETISYYGDGGVAETLKDLEEIGYTGVYENDYILGLTKGEKVITLEPGSQFELSIVAKKELKDLEREYLEFLKDIIPILEKKNQGLMTTGYHPVTKIDDIKLLPKKRYDYMFEYFKKRGSHAHNMMKGTAALQVSLDFKSEEDFKKKFKVLNALSPVLYALFENAYYFEGEPWDVHNIRSFIWINCDIHRSGIVDGALEDDFGYKSYAEYILNRPAIFNYKDGEYIFTDEKLVRDILDPENYKEEELEHLLSMFFPDVRTKRYVEVRMMDSIPYPLNFSAMAFLVGLIYDEDNLNRIFKDMKDLTIEEVNKTKEDMVQLGVKAKLGDRTILEIGKKLVKLARTGLKEEDKRYLDPLEEMLNRGQTLYEITKEKSQYGKKESLKSNLLNNLPEVKR